MQLIVGLGNPGKKYFHNRHNAGQLALHEIISAYKLQKVASKLPAIVFKNKKLIAMQPKTFMNECGASCAAVANFYKINSSNIIVLYDDLDMELGKVRVKTSGSDGGHNGIKSINSFMDNSYVKIKIGIGRGLSVNSYVLSDFTEEEMKIMQPVFNNIAKLFDHILQGELEKFGSAINNL